MHSFLTRYATKIKGVVSGFDRVRFRGTLRWPANCSGMGSWLWHNQVLLKNFMFGCGNVVTLETKFR